MNRERLRELAINWQSSLQENDCSLDYITRWADFFWKYGKKYGLLEEFEQNGIC